MRRVSRSSAIVPVGGQRAGLRGEVEQPDPPVGAGDLEHPVAVDDVGLGGFEQMRGDLAALLDDRIDRRDERAADRHRRARRDRAGARHAVVAVALLEIDLFDRDAEPLGGEPAIERAMALAARLHPDREQQFALAGKRERRALAGLAAGDFEKARDAEPAPLAGALGRPRPACLKCATSARSSAVSNSAGKSPLS